MLRSSFYESKGRRHADDDPESGSRAPRRRRRADKEEDVTDDHEGRRDRRRRRRDYARSRRRRRRRDDEERSEPRRQYSDDDLPSNLWRSGRPDEDAQSDDEGLRQQFQPVAQSVVIHSGISQYLRPEASRLNGGLADYKLDSKRMGNALDSEAQKFNRVSSKLVPNGAVIQDKFATGVKPDLAADRDFPYQCSRCQLSFITAVQLSDHLFSAHQERLHPSLIKPKAAAKLSERLDDLDE